MSSLLLLKGISAAPGLAMAPALVIDTRPLIISKKVITLSDVATEWNRLEDAISKSQHELSEIMEKTKQQVGEDEAAIFQAHIMLVSDPELIDKTKNEIKDNLVNAEYAFQKVSLEFIAMFDAMDDEYMRERALDVKDISKRVLRHLLNVQEADLSNLSEEVVLVGYDLTPSQIATMDKSKVVALITEIGGKTSHTAIMANSLEIAAVVGIKDVAAQIKSGDLLVVDGNSGEVIRSPDDSAIKKFNRQREHYQATIKSYESFKGVASKTPDGKLVKLLANVASLDELKTAIRNDAEGIGLFRTEFLYMNRLNSPSEEEQFQIYRQVLEQMKNRPVTIRTIDIGGDKEVEYLHLKKELNPFLGVRAIRLCMQRPELFITQLRAMFRASIYGKLKIMFPMISSLDELLEVKLIVERVKEELTQEKIKFDSQVAIGIMIEIPSAAIISDILAKHVDFFSIGTNDLIQYVVAVDRLNENLEYLYNPYNPAVLRLINLVIANAHKEGIEVGMCGSVAGKEEMIPLLLGMDLTEFSMSAGQILPARKIISSTNYKDAKKMASYVLSLSQAKEIETYLHHSQATSDLSSNLSPNLSPT
ncbi:MAG: phosphoenolpyruvate--protein phosphotransferase [Oligoflexia bacterium]|nr:phosphoenolpyruvate--protein phosphotransferase [Oligoflexia bacterium]